MEHVKPMSMTLVNPGKTLVVKLIETPAVVSGKIQPAKAIKMKVPINVQFFINTATTEEFNGNFVQGKPYQVDGEIKRALSKFLLVEPLKSVSIQMKEGSAGPIPVITVGLVMLVTTKFLM